MSPPVVLVARPSSGAEPRGCPLRLCSWQVPLPAQSQGEVTIWMLSSWQGPLPASEPSDGITFASEYLKKKKHTDRFRICFLTFFLFSLPVVGTSHNFFCSIIQGVFSKLLSASFYYKFFPPNFWKKIITLPQQRLI